MCILSILFIPLVRAEDYSTGTVQAIISEGTVNTGGTTTFYQNSKISISDSESIDATSSSPYKPRDQVILLKNPDGTYQIIDHSRQDQLIFIALSFIVLVLVMSGFRGMGSILGMLFSLFMLLKFLVPHILAGRNPLLISILCSAIIMIVNIYLAHGKNRTTHIALISTLIALILTGIISVFFVYLTKLTGLGSEEASFLQLDANHLINLKGLLLGGMIIGSLGVLDDVTTSQSAAIFELAKANPGLVPRKLIASGLTIGREHVNSLVNTLVLAYAGASLPLFILFVQNPAGQPLWYILNSEPIAEEIVRTISGSIGLILAVPITTFLASYSVKKFQR